MAASGVEAIIGTNTSLLHQTDSAPLEKTDPIALQAIKSLSCENNALSSTSNGYIDPKSALCPPILPVGPSMTLPSAQQSHCEAEQEPFLSQDFAQGELIFSSCSEDAEGEPDESFHLEHSYWMTHPGDTSASTVATLDVDDPPIPLLGRDGTWKSAAPRTVATRDDARSEGERQGGTSQPPLSLDQLGKNSKPGLLYNSLNIIACPKRRPSFSSSDSGDVPLSRSTAKQQKKSRPNKTRDDVGPGEPVPRAKRTSKKRSKSTKPRKKAPSKAVSSSNSKQKEPVASSETGSVASARKPSSPASSTGRYKLRKKESVPRLSLSSLLTPPRNSVSPASDEAVDGSADWVDQPERERDATFVSSRAQTPEASTTKLEDSYEADNSGELDELDTSSALPSPAGIRDTGQRTFPTHWEIHPDFPLLYQRYCVPSSVSPEVLEMLLRCLNHANVDDEFHEIIDRAQTVQGAFNKPRSILDLYTPRFVKGVSSQKVGMCPVCYEDGKVKFFKTKFSAYNYHLQNFHGICALTGLPFTPPSKFRGKSRPNAKPKERKEIIQGLCHSCNKYIDMQGPKETEVKVVEIYWWKHAQACHRSSTVPEGVGGYFKENKWFEKICGVLELLGGVEGELRKLLRGNK